jgi:pheromone shutdown-related protein TraB
MMKNPLLTAAPCADGYPDDVHSVQLGDREIILVGTAHISRESANLVRKVIEQERPDGVCIELDEKRYEALAKRKRWEILDLREIMRRKQLATLLVNLVLASYQKKLGDQLGVLPGTELLEAARAAEDNAIPVALCDRDVRVTLRRAWHATPFLKKGYLLVSLIASLFDRTEITEEKLAELRGTDVISELMREMGEVMPELKRALIDERDTFLAEKIKETPGRRLVAVVGAGHMAGIKQALSEDRHGQMAEINTTPVSSSLMKTISWLVPALILSALVFIGFSKGAEVVGENLLFWILANGIPAALGAAVALAHPFTVLVAFTAAPITSLTPVIGAGYVTAFTQLMLRPPMVKEFETVLADMGSLRGWWRNKLLRILLAFILPGFGSMIGTWVGGVKILSNIL